MNRTISFVLLLTFVSSVLYAAEPGKAKLRTWKDVTGKFSVQAVFVRVRSGQAVLRRTDNKEISVPITKLSVTDRQYVQFFHAVAVLGKLDAKIKRNKQGDVIEVIGDRRFINPVLVHLKGLTKLQTLVLRGSNITDAGLVHLKGLTELKYVNQGTASNPRPRLGLHSSRLTGMPWRPSTSPPLQSGRKGVRHVLSVVCDVAEDTASPLCRCHDQSPRILDEAGCSRTHRVRRRLSQPQTLADHGLRRSVLPVMSRHAREPGRRAHSPAG